LSLFRLALFCTINNYESFVHQQKTIFYHQVGWRLAKTFVCLEAVPQWQTTKTSSLMTANVGVNVKLRSFFYTIRVYK